MGLYKRRFLIIFLLLILLAGGVYFFSQKREVSYGEKLKDLEASLKLIQWVNRSWSEGDFDNQLASGKLICKQFPIVKSLDQDFTKCNPEYLDCLIKNNVDNNGQLSLFGSSFQIEKKNNKVYQPIEKAKFHKQFLNQNYYLSFKNNQQKSFHIYLQDSCRDLYLEENKYAVNEYNSNQNDWYWNNTNRLIFIDKYPIRNYKYKLWMNKKSNFLPDDFVTFAQNFNEKDLERYCSLHGGKIIEGHIFDAASFFPTFRDENSKNYFRGNYFWKKENILEEDLKCNTFFTKECLGNQNNFNIASLKTPSWVGMLHVQGGIIQYIKNKRDAKKAFFPSSSLFSQDSLFHFLGKKVANEELVKMFEKFNYSARCMIEKEYNEI